MTGRWSLPVPPDQLRQPDNRTCGATALVVARMLLDGEYAARLASEQDRAAAVRAASLAAHRACTRTLDDRGRPQVPWPPSLGTPPWTVARQLSRIGLRRRPPVRYRVVPALWSRGRVYDRLLDTTSPVVLYVGNEWSPRHVVLVVGTVGGRLVCHNPSRGRLVEVDRDAFVGGRLPFGRFGIPWCLVLPRPAAAR